VAEVVSFMANGPAKTIAGEIEACALAQGLVSALVVPWESTPTTLNMAVTAVRGEGWAIEHTNLGTVTLSDLGGTSTRVVAARADVDAKLAALFDGFARELQSRFATSDPRTGQGDQRSL